MLYSPTGKITHSQDWRDSLKNVDMKKHWYMFLKIIFSDYKSNIQKEECLEINEISLLHSPHPDILLLF